MSSRTIAPAFAFLIITFAALVGPLVAGTAVAQTIGRGIVDYRDVGVLPLAGGIAGGLVALLMAFVARLPVSASVALVSATIGSLIVTHQLRALMWPGVAKVAFALVGSIVVGFAIGAIAYVLTVLVFSRLRYRTGKRIMALQYASVALLAAGYGANDAEKMMGLIVAAIAIGSPGSSFAVPFWVIALSIAAFATGMALGGPRVARTVGGKLFSIRPIHALSFQAAAAATVLTAAALGGPLSTTETTASAIMGVGAAANPRRLHWQVVRNLCAAWLLTAPMGLLLGIAATALLRSILHGAG